MPPIARNSVTVAQGRAFGLVDEVPLLLDIYRLPIGDVPRPAVILIHGGGMWTGSRAHMAEPALALANAGYVAFSVDYRLVEAITGRNRWPAQLDDVQRAVRWVRANSGQFGVDPLRLGAYGWSAGGQLAALLGTRETRDDSDPTLTGYSSRVSCVIDLSGDVDLTAYTDPPERDEVAALLGGSPTDVPERYRDASPLTWIDQDTVPHLVIHGSSDVVVPIEHSRRLVSALQEANASVHFVELPDVGHQDLDWSQVGPVTLSFLSAYLIFEI